MYTVFSNYETMGNKGKFHEVKFDSFVSCKIYNTIFIRFKTEEILNILRLLLLF